ncbi:calcium-binding protein P-like [Eriocheir sinensis]|uniref:calcium-binding protein P-like n=1 Tax=Eriocheir sinensis TaxID=95602 RepID=UPI0021C71C18|nr:calcium-binding protein P-like [Eriocheir sinensis]XP_050711002.1 calcium-binding protein P-like [Eriocheir sinensis]
MKELLALLLVLVVTVNGGRPYNQGGHSVGPQKFVRDPYGTYRPVPDAVGGPPFGRPFGSGGGRPSHAAASHIHGQSGFQQGGFPSHQNNFQQGGFPSHQNNFQQGGFPSNQGGFPSNQGGFPSNQGGFGGDVPIIPLPNRPSVGIGQVGSDIDISQFARNKPGAGKGSR